MIEVYIHMSKINDFKNYNQVFAVTMFPAQDHIKLILDVDSVNIIEQQTNRLILCRKKPFIVKFKDLFKRKTK